MVLRVSIKRSMYNLEYFAGDSIICRQARVASGSSNLTVVRRALVASRPAIGAVMANADNIVLITTTPMPQDLNRPCVDCGRYTGSFCEFECLAARRIPSERWRPGQLTPHCTFCDRRHGCCHFCRGVQMVTPPPWGLGTTRTLGVVHEGEATTGTATGATTHAQQQ